MPKDLNDLLSKPTEPTLVRAGSEVTRSSVLDSSYIDESLREQLAGADLLFIPDDDAHGSGAITFPVGTREVFQYMRDNIPSPGKVEIAIRDEDYVELALYDTTIIITTFVTTRVFLPVVLNLLSRWIEDRLGVRFTKAQVKARLIVEEKDGRSFDLQYEGPAKTFTETVRDALPGQRDDS